MTLPNDPKEPNRCWRRHALWWAAGLAGIVAGCLVVWHLDSRALADTHDALKTLITENAAARIAANKALEDRLWRSDEKTDARLKALEVETAKVRVVVNAVDKKVDRLLEQRP